MSKEFDQFLKDNIEYLAENHVEGWIPRYENQTIEQSEYDLEVNHDVSIEIDFAEEELGRELTTDEWHELVSEFNEAVLRELEERRIHL